MRSTSIGLGLFLVALTAGATMAQQKQAAGSQTPASPSESRKEDEKAIRDAAEAFAKAYNAHDAKAVAALFTVDGEIVDESGDWLQGHEAIVWAFGEIFRLHPKAKIQSTIESVRFVGPSVAIEDGTSTVTHLDDAGTLQEHSRYTVVHIKQAGQWRMASARDYPNEPASANEELSQLGWMVGEWVDEGPNELVLTTYHWTNDHKFLQSDFTIQVAGKPAMTGTQRIGWNPLTKKLHSWVFDSQGGFAEGVWTRNGNQWIVKMTGLTHDGKASSSTNVLTRKTSGRMTWQSRDRIVGMEAMPNIPEIPVVRKPPRPQTAVPSSRPATGESR
jgi:uncharacterized protein (TIGR02246 family)